VTAEIAVALPAVLIVLALVISVGRALTAQVQCIDAARAGARLAARGEPDARSVSEALLLGPGGTHVDVRSSGQVVTVRVSVVLRLPIGLSVPVGAAAEADREQP
jgi:TadE-like protein